MWHLLSHRSIFLISSIGDARCTMRKWEQWEHTWRAAGPKRHLPSQTSFFLFPQACMAKSDEPGDETLSRGGVVEPYSSCHNRSGQMNEGATRQVISSSARHQTPSPSRRFVKQVLLQSYVVLYWFEVEFSFNQLFQLTSYLAE